MDNKEIIGVFIDDSGKIYDKNKYINYTATIFKNLHEYWNFSIEFNYYLKTFNKGQEIKGSFFWTKHYSWEIKEKLLRILKKYNNTHIFSFILNKNNLKNKYKNDVDSEGILNNCIAMLCNYVAEKLKLYNYTFVLFIDEQIRKNFKNKNNLISYLNYPKPKLESLKMIRERKIDFLVYEN